ARFRVNRVSKPERLDDYIPAPNLSKGPGPFVPELTTDGLHWPEGEKDTDTLAGLDHLAFTFGGTGKIPDEAVRCVKDRKVVVHADSGEAGEKHAHDKARFALHHRAGSGRIVGYDGFEGVTHRLGERGSQERLARIAAASPLQPPAGVTQDAEGIRENPEPSSSNGVIRLTFYNELVKPVPKLWGIKGVFARGETSSWVGPP